jgi:hypothetical protein
MLLLARDCPAADVRSPTLGAQAAQAKKNAAIPRRLFFRLVAGENQAK